MLDSIVVRSAKKTALMWKELQDDTAEEIHCRRTTLDYISDSFDSDQYNTAMLKSELNRWEAFEVSVKEELLRIKDLLEVVKVLS